MKRLLILALLFAGCTSDDEADGVNTVVVGITPQGGRSSYIPYSPTGGIDTISTQAYVNKVNLSNVKLATTQTLLGNNTYNGFSTFKGNSTGANPSVLITGGNPQFEMLNTLDAVNFRRWNIVTGGVGYTFRLLNDNGSVNKNIYSVVTDKSVVNNFLFNTKVKVINQDVASKLVLGKYDSGSGHRDSPTTLGVESQYLSIGGIEYGQDTYRTIGFGYTYDNGGISPVSIGIQEKNTGGATFGDLVFNTRSTTANVAPVTRLRISSDGKIMTENGAKFIGGGIPTVAINTTLKTLPTSASLNTLYPTAEIGSSVYATNMPGGVQVYIKISNTQWTANPVSVI